MAACLAQPAVPVARGFRHTAWPQGCDRRRPLANPPVTESPHLPPATTRSALPSVLLRALGLAVAAVLGWVAVDRGMLAWVQHEDAIIGQVARYVPQQDPDRLQPLLALGEDPLVTVVLACDLAQPKCRQQLARLAAWQGQPSVVLRQADSEDPARASGEVRRLVYLPRAEPPAGLVLAQTLHALDGQGLFWRSVADWAKDPAVWTAATLDRALHAVPYDPQRLARDRDNAETLLAVRVEQTMAEALEVPQDSGLLVAGLPVAATQSDGAALAAVLARAEQDMAENLKFYGGDVSLAHARSLAALPQRTRDRYVRWILIGKKVSSLPGVHSDSEPDASDEPEDEEP